MVDLVGPWVMQVDRRRRRHTAAYPLPRGMAVTGRQLL